MEPPSSSSNPTGHILRVELNLFDSYKLYLWNRVQRKRNTHFMKSLNVSTQHDWKLTVWKLNNYRKVLPEGFRGSLRTISKNLWRVIKCAVTGSAGRRLSAGFPALRRTITNVCQQRCGDSCNTFMCTLPSRKSEHIHSTASQTSQVIRQGIHGKLHSVWIGSSSQRCRVSAFSQPKCI